jgi:hypothetical protein
VGGSRTGGVGAVFRSGAGSADARGRDDGAAGRAAGAGAAAAGGAGGGSAGAACGAGSVEGGGASVVDCVQAPTATAAASAGIVQHLVVISTLGTLELQGSDQGQLSALFLVISRLYASCWPASPDETAIGL